MMYVLVLKGSGYNDLAFNFRGEDAVEQMATFVEIVEAHTADADLEIVIKKVEVK